jgi:hypothetical protein
MLPEKVKRETSRGTNELLKQAPERATAGGGATAYDCDCISRRGRPCACAAERATRSPRPPAPTPRWPPIAPPAGKLARRGKYQQLTPYFQRNFKRTLEALAFVPNGAKDDNPMVTCACRVEPEFCNLAVRSHRLTACSYRPGDLPVCTSIRSGLLQSDPNLRQPVLGPMC